MYKSLSSIVVLSCALVGPTTSRADVIVETLEYGHEMNGSIHTYEVNQFDLSMGELNSVTPTLYYTITADVAIENTSGVPVTQKFTFEYKQDVYLNYEEATSIIQLPMEHTFTLTESDDEPGVGEDLGQFKYVHSSSKLIPVETPPSDFYIGEGTFAVAFQENVKLNFSSYTNTNISVSNLKTFGHMDIEYDYTPVPEPASLGLACVSGFMLLRRKRA